jgi:hypothetical protein
MALLGAALLVCAPAPGFGAVIYVDKDSGCPGQGLRSTPYCSIQQAFDAARPGDRLRIRKASVPYDEYAVTKRSGLPGNPIILEAEDPAKPPILRYSGRAAPHGGGAIQIYGSEYWTVRNLVFDGSGIDPSVSALWVTPGGGATHGQRGIQILDNVFKDWGGSESWSALHEAPAALTINGGWALPLGSPLPDGTVIRGNLFDGDRLIALALDSTRNTVVEHNEFKNTTCGLKGDGAGGRAVLALGIHDVAGTPGRAAGEIIRDNIFHDFAAWSLCNLKPTHGSYTEMAAFHCDVDPGDGTVEGNRVWNLGYVAGGPAAAAIAIIIEQNCHGWVVRNNLIYNVGWSGIRHAPGTDGAPNRFLNNTIHNTGMHAIELATGNAIVELNILSSAAVAQIAVAAAAVAQGNLAIDRNDYWSPSNGDAVGRWGGLLWQRGRVMNFEQWKDACKGCDAGSLDTDPKFIDPGGGDFRLSPLSPAIGMGVQAPVIR